MDGTIIIYFILGLLGAVSGILSGFLGIGGGLLVVPVLNIIFLRYGFGDSSYLISTTTSLLIMVLTTFSAARMHLSHKHINLKDSRLVILVVAATSMLIGLLPIFLSSKTDISSLTFLSLTFLIAFRLFKMDVSESKTVKVFSNRGLVIVLVFLTLLGSWQGIGVGALLVPWLLSRGFDFRRATAIGVTASFTLALTNSILRLGLSYSWVEVVNAPSLVNVENVSLFGIYGAISTVVFIIVGGVSFITAPLGVILTRKIQPRIFRRVVVLFLVALAAWQSWVFIMDMYSA